MSLNTIEQLRAGELAGCRRLKLSCGLTEFTPEIFDLAETLEILDLSGNALSSLPDDLHRLHRLRILFCSDNQFTVLPEILGQCSQLSMVGFKANRIRTVPAAALPTGLRWLILTDNAVAEMPPEIGHCIELQKCMLAGNQLTALPAEMANCTRLELLRIAANRLTMLPGWLLSLPRLAWLAYAGNPFCASVEAKMQAKATIAAVSWGELAVEHQLGEGASGVIHQAQWLAADGRQAVAVKLFKGALTSDGLPHNEMAACLGAGRHPNLIPVLGKLAQHPAATHGLVMALIDASFGNLAGPPSLASCTRDVYAENTLFTLDTALRIVLGSAAAAQHLHAQGIMHGDLYAHNILHCPQGRALLGDFGAASVFARDDQVLTNALQRIEVRAFGCLLEELIARCIATVDGENARKTLIALQADCAQERVSARPLFDEIVAILRGLIGHSQLVC
jgi:hypothetical protein